MKKRSTTLLIGAFAITALLGACSDDKKSSGSTDTVYCGLITSYKAKANELDSVMSGTEAAAIKAAFTTMQGEVHALDANPPASIAKDVHLMTDTVDRMIAIFVKYDYDFTKLAAAPEATELNTLIDSPDYKSAQSNLKAYSKDVCNIPDDTTGS